MPTPRTEAKPFLTVAPVSHVSRPRLASREFSPWQARMWWCALMMLALLAGSGRLQAQAAIQATPVIKTYAGSSVTGASGGVGSGLQQLAVDSAGNLYVVDTVDSVIVKVPAGGGSSTVVAGRTGSAGYGGDNGPATLASLKQPEGVAVDSAGNLYIADSNNCIIRKVNTSGIITTVAGTPGSCGNSGDNGAATSAKLYTPAAVSVDSAGNIFIADQGNHEVREVNTSGIITRIAGTGSGGSPSGFGGPATSAVVGDPLDVLPDNQGSIYIVDNSGSNVDKVVLSTGIITRYAGTSSAGFSGDGGPASSASLYYPNGIGMDSAGNLYVADSINNRIREINVSTGIINTIAGTGSASYGGDGGAPTSAVLNNPTDVAIDSNNDVYILDQNNDAVREIVNGVGEFPVTAVGSSSASQTFYFKTNAAVTITPIAMASGFSDFTIGALRGTGCGVFTSIVAGTTCNLTLTFNPKAPGLRQDPLVITDSSGNKYNFGLHGIGTGPAVAFREGIISTVAGNGTAGFSGDGGAATSAQISSPIGMTIDTAGNLYIADTSNYRVRKIDTSGNISTIAGNGTYGDTGDGGAATAAEMKSPYDVAVDAAGDVYILDDSACVVRKVDGGTGLISTVAGTGSCGNTGDGTATTHELRGPIGVAVDGSGNLYIADSSNEAIRKVDTSGNMTTIAGTLGSSGSSGDGGLATAALLSNPMRVVVDASGNVYILDNGNEEVRKITAATGIITTVAGHIGAVAGSGDGGPATSAGLTRAVGLAVDNAGNIYITENFAYRIRRVDAGTGIITTIAGNGTGADTGDGGLSTAAEVKTPVRPVTDAAGDLYWVENASSYVRKISAAPHSLDLGSTTTGAPTSAQTFSVTNVGNTSLTLSGLSFSSTVFSQTTSGGTDCSSSTVLASGVSCQIAVIATPSASGTTTGTLTVTDNTLNAAGTTQTVNLTVSGKQTQSITFTNPVAQAAGTSITLAATASSGLPVTYTLNSGPATLSGSTLTFTGTGTVQIEADQAGNSTYAAATPVTVSITVNSAASTTTLAASPTSLTYGGGNVTLTASVAASATNIDTPSGTVNFYNGGTLLGSSSLSGGSASFSLTSLTAGSYSLTATYSGDSIFATSTNAPATALTVSQATPAVTWTAPAAMTYGTALSATQLNATASMAGTFRYSPAAGTVVGAGAQTLSVTFTPTDTTDYTTVTKTVSLTVNKAALTVTANNAVRTYGDANPTFAASYSGFVNGDTATVLTGAPSLTTTATAASNAGNYTITAGAGSLAAANYSFSFVNGTLTVNQAALTVTANNASRTYGSANPAFTASYSGFKNSDTAAVLTGAPALTTSATAASNAGSYTITAGAGTLAASNYSFSFVNGTLTVNKAVLTVTAGNATRTYGTANPTFAATISGYVNGDTAAVVTGTAALTTTATTASPVGSYAITAAQGTLAAANYSFSFVPATLTVSQASTSVTWTAPAAIPYGTPLSATQLNATASVAGTITYSPALGTVLTAGTHTLTATFTPADTADYTGSSQTVTLTVNKAALTVTAGNATRTYGASNPAFAATISGYVNGDTVAVVTGTPALTTTATATSPVGSYAITAAQGTLAAANYSFSFVPATLTVSQASTSVTWTAPAAIPYGTPLSATQLNATASVAGTITYSPALGTVLTAGTHTLTATFTPTDTADYTGSSQTVALTVNKAVLTVTAGNATRTYGVSNPAFTATISGYVNGDTAAVVTGTPALTTTATATSPVGSYAITAAQGTLAAANYSFVFVPGTLTVTPASTSVTWTTPAAVTYGTPLSAAQLNATASVAGTISYSPALGTVLTAGTHTLTATFTPTDTADYTGSSQTVVLTVNPAVLTVTAQNATRIYGAANPAFTATISGYVNGDTAAVVAGAPSLTTTATTASPVGSYAITAAQGTLAAANYSFSFVPATLTVTQASTSVTWTAPAAIPYGTPLSSAQLNATGSVAGTISYSPALGTVLTAGTHTLTAAFTPTDTADYTGSTQTVTLTVNKAMLTVTAGNATRIYGAANPAFNATISGYVNGDTAAVVTGAPALTTTATTASPAGAYAITATQGTLAAANYSFAFAPGTLTITPQALTLALTPSATALVHPAGLTLTAAVSGAAGTPSGTVTFTDGSIIVGMVALSNGTATLNVPSPAVGAHSYAAAYSGDQNHQPATAVAAAVTVVPAPATAMLSSISLSFGSQTITTRSAAQTVTLANQGELPLGITSVTASGPFTVTNSCGTSLAGASSCALAVTFAPVQTGAQTGTLTVVDSVGTQTVSLSGSGQEIGLTLTPAGLSFGSQTVNTTSGSQNFVLTNSGTVDLPVTSITAAGDFRIVSHCPAMLTAGGSCSMAVTFTPSAAGVRAGGVTVVAGSAQQTAALSGTGVAPVTGTLALLPENVSFGSVALGQTSAAEMVTLLNPTPASINVGAVSATSSFAVSNACPATLAAGAHCQIAVVFTPQAAGAATGVLKAGTLTAGLTGVGAQGLLRLSPASLNFGSVAVGAASPAQTVVVSNRGTVAVTVTSLSGGADVAENDDCVGQTLAPGANCTVNVALTPVAEGARTANVVVNSTAGPVDIGVSGFGTVPVAAAQATVAPVALNFGSIAVGAVSGVQTVTVSNAGTAALNIASITATGGFADATDCPATLAPGARCTVNVTAAPTAEGPALGSLLIQDDAGTQLVALSGVGVKPGVAVSPSFLAFGSQTIGAVSQPQTVTVTNTGAGDLHLTAVTTSGDFVVTNHCPGTLPAGANCAISVALQPSTTGTRTGLLMVHDDAPGGVQTVGLSGAGLVAGVTLSPAQLNFGSVPVGQSSPTRTVTVSNGLATPLQVVSIAGSGDWNVTSYCGSQIAAGGRCTFSVAVTPTLPGALTGQVTVDLQPLAGLSADRAAGARAVAHAVTEAGAIQGMVAVEATSAPASVQLTPTALDFGSQAVGSTSPVQTVTVTNQGGSTLGIQSLTASSGYAVNSTCGASLAAGASCTAQVSFTPAAAGAVTGALSLSDDLGTQTVALTGSGVQSGLSVSPADLDFGRVLVGSTAAAQTVTITNNASSAYALGAIATTGDFSATTACPATLAANSSCTVAVTLKPVATDQRTGALSVGGATPITVGLRGQGEDFALTPASPKGKVQTVVVSGVAQYTLTLTSIGYSGAVNFSCMGAPAHSLCAVSPGMVEAQDGKPAAVTVTVKTYPTLSSNSRQTAGAALMAGLGTGGGNGSGRSGLLALLSLAGLLLLGSLALGGHRRTLLLAGALLMGGLLLAGCGGNPNRSGGIQPTQGTAPGQYTLTVTATTPNGVSRSTQLTLNVQ